MSPITRIKQKEDDTKDEKGTSLAQPLHRMFWSSYILIPSPKFQT
jgi:hypothetical protein